MTPDARQAAAARHPVAVLPGLLRGARHDDGPGRLPVNAVRGLLDFIARLVGDRKPSRLVAAMDADWRPAFRVEAIPSYKAHRVATGRRGGGSRRAVPAGRRSSRTSSRRSASPASASTGYEADDVIGTLAIHDPGPVDIVTGDRDLFQLVDDSRAVRVLYTARGVGRADVVDEAWVAAKYGIPGRSYADFATLRGDPSDGLPGVAGVGDKTAAALITKYGSLTALLEALDAGDTAMPAGARSKLAASRDYLAVAPKVVAVAARRADAGVRRRDPRHAARPGPAGRAVAALGAGQPAQPGAVGVHRGAPQD